MGPRAARRRRKGECPPQAGGGIPAAAAVLVCVSVLAASPGSSFAQPGPHPSFEQDVKASFIYTVAKFVDWPENSFGGPAAPMVFAILGDDPIEEALLRAVEGKRVGGHPVAVVKAETLDDLALCHVLFVGRSEAPRLREVLGRLRGSTTLTVSEADRFAQHGGVMGLRLDQNMIRFEVNVDAAERSRLAISSKILKLGKVVRDRKRAQGAP